MAATAQQRIKCTIHVSSLPPEATKELLMAAFIPFGEIADIQIPRNEDGKTSRRQRHLRFCAQINALGR
jgi:RNA recognition motif-containing protein